MRVAFFGRVVSSVVGSVVGSVVALNPLLHKAFNLFFFFYYKKRDYTVVSHTPYTARVTTVTTVTTLLLKPFSRLAIFEQIYYRGARDRGKFSE